MLLLPLLSGCEFDVKPMDILSLENRSRSNDALACAMGVCAVPADIESPVYAVSIEELLTIAKAVIDSEPRTKYIAMDEKLKQLVFVQRSRIFRFPDTIWLQAVQTDTGSSVILYSRSNYGNSDLGTNKRRIRAWLTKLTERIEKPGTGNYPSASPAAASFAFRR